MYRPAKVSDLELLNTEYNAMQLTIIILGTGLLAYMDVSLQHPVLKFWLPILRSPGSGCNRVAITDKELQVLHVLSTIPFSSAHFLQIS